MQRINHHVERRKLYKEEKWLNGSEFHRFRDTDIKLDFYKYGIVSRPQQHKFHKDINSLYFQISSVTFLHIFFKIICISRDQFWFRWEHWYLEIWAYSPKKKHQLVLISFKVNYLFLHILTYSSNVHIYM
jgi:hypothetical protein